MKFYFFTYLHKCCLTADPFAQFIFGDVSTHVLDSYNTFLDFIQFSFRANWKLLIKLYFIKLIIFSWFSQKSSRTNEIPWVRRCQLHSNEKLIYLSTFNWIVILLYVHRSRLRSELSSSTYLNHFKKLIHEINVNKTPLDSMWFQI